MTHGATTMTTLLHDLAPRMSSAPRHRAATATARRFRTVLAIHRGEVYVPSSELPDSGWLVRATAAAAEARMQALRAAA
jgi:hypothetical protein